MREIKENKIYRHFKGNVYKVLYIGFNGEDNIEENPRKMVVYQSNHDGKVWIRSYDNFASKVDKDKYPNAEQEYRFEEVE